MSDQTVGFNPRLARERVTLQQAEAYLDDTAGLSNAEQRQLKQFVTVYRSRLTNERDHRVSELAAADAAKAEELALTLKDRQGRLAALRADVEHGRASSADLRAALQSARAAMEQARGEADEFTLNYTQRAKQAEQDVVEMQNDTLRRFPVMRGTLPALLGEFPKSTAPRLGPTQHRRGNVDAGQGLHGRADALYAEVTESLRALEAAEQREKALAGTPQSLVDKFPAARDRLARS